MNEKRDTQRGTEEKQKNHHCFCGRRDCRKFPHLNVEIKMARADGYNKGTGDILKALLSDNK